MNTKETMARVNSLAGKCFKEVEVIDNESNTFIINNDNQYFVVKITACQEFPYELSNRFKEKQVKRKEREERKLMKKVKEFFT